MQEQPVPERDCGGRRLRNLRGQRRLRPCPTLLSLRHPGLATLRLLPPSCVLDVVETPQWSRLQQRKPIARPLLEIMPVCGDTVCRRRTGRWLKPGAVFFLQCNKLPIACTPYFFFLYFGKCKVVMRLWPPKGP
ncbi:hypothetical protein HU200_067601 [Digitaria exilis]|uniref:Uncharacterized protein n=1 Tax=Digitaria exilis TaxID=1010633 RepID=A0A834ZUR3_9POAL|nr:hypothetical protein HU200_067601 [Digitaria exilis]